MASGWRFIVNVTVVVKVGYPVLGTQYRESSSQLLGGITDGTEKRFQRDDVMFRIKTRQTVVLFQRLWQGKRYPLPPLIIPCLPVVFNENLLARSIIFNLSRLYGDFLKTRA